MSIFDGYIHINPHHLDISTLVMIAGVYEHLIVTCGDLGKIANPAFWETIFHQLHDSHQTITGFLFTPAHCKNTGNRILAKMIFTGRQVMFNDRAATGYSQLVMFHKPGS
jgi:hypothetical protein